MVVAVTPALIAAMVVLPFGDISTQTATPMSEPPILKGFKRYNVPEFVEDNMQVLGYHPSFQRCYFAKVPASEVIKRVKFHLDPELWKWEKSFNEFTESTWTIWNGKAGTVYEDWSVGVLSDTSTPEWHGASDLVIVGKKAKGWTTISIFAPARREELPRVRELFRFTFGDR
jgi:hypothetical protein